MLCRWGTRGSGRLMPHAVAVAVGRADKMGSKSRSLSPHRPQAHRGHVLSAAGYPCQLLDPLPLRGPTPVTPQAHRGQTVSVADYAAAEPDVLRKAAPELVATWNE